LNHWGNHVSNSAIFRARRAHVSHARFASKSSAAACAASRGISPSWKRGSSWFQATARDLRRLACPTDRVAAGSTSESLPRLQQPDEVRADADARNVESRSATAPPGSPRRRLSPDLRSPSTRQGDAALDETEVSAGLGAVTLRGRCRGRRGADGGPHHAGRRTGCRGRLPGRSPPGRGALPPSSRRGNRPPASEWRAVSASVSGPARQRPALVRHRDHPAHCGAPALVPRRRIQPVCPFTVAEQ